MAYVYLLFPGFRMHFQAFFANRVYTCEIEMTSSMHTLEGALLSCKNAFEESKLHFLVAYKYCKQQMRATSGLSYNASFLRQLAGKWVSRGKCWPNLRKAGHLVCLLKNITASRSTQLYATNNIKCSGFVEQTLTKF